MSRAEIVRAKIIKQVIGRRKTQAAAAAELSLSVRQIKRLCSSYRLDGPRGLISKKLGILHSALHVKRWVRRAAKGEPPLLSDNYGVALGHAASGTSLFFLGKSAGKAVLFGP